MLAHKRKNEFTSVGNVYRIRNASDLNVPYQRLFITQRPVYHNVPTFHNRLPNQLKDILPISRFKYLLKIHLTNLFHKIKNIFIQLI